jgi:hypothetical protein
MDLKKFEAARARLKMKPAAARHVHEWCDAM